MEKLVVSYWISTSNHNRLPVLDVQYGVVSYWISTSNHNDMNGDRNDCLLYLIEFLHQTTTLRGEMSAATALYLIEFLHQTTTRPARSAARWCCILLNFYIKPQLGPRVVVRQDRCILLNFYIKPQPRSWMRFLMWVVSYWISTSNHNGNYPRYQFDSVVSYWISTSNHNSGCAVFKTRRLYLIEFLHQTTTLFVDMLQVNRLYLIEFLHQTTTNGLRLLSQSGCILLNFYIKPKQTDCAFWRTRVVSYWISTSNHNYQRLINWFSKLYLIEFLHQTTTRGRSGRSRLRLYLIEFLHQTTTVHNRVRGAILLYLIEFLHQTTTIRGCGWSSLRLYLIEFLHQTTTFWVPIQLYHRCILLNFYIKPQLSFAFCRYAAVVSYWISTSNHNHQRRRICEYMLYLIEFLHQTTTLDGKLLKSTGCILLNFYIKPQLDVRMIRGSTVVSYWISTSNHNVGTVIGWFCVFCSRLMIPEISFPFVGEVDLMSFFVFQRTNIAKYLRKTPTAGVYPVLPVRFFPRNSEYRRIVCP